MRVTRCLFLILTLNTILLLVFSYNISISKYEADIFFNGANYLRYILDSSVLLFGQNDFAIRFPFILLHIFNSILIILISKDIVKKREDIILVLLIFILLPGINTSALIISKTGIIIFFTLIFVYSYKVFSKNSYYILLILALFDNAFLYLFVSLAFYGLYKKDNRLLLFSILSLALNYSIFGLDTGGIPQGYFLDIFSTYAAVFSPLVFLFFIYALYWQFKKSATKLHILWFISAISFILSMILSLRQNIKIEDFAPFAVIYIPFVVYAFYNSYRIRLPEFRQVHKIAFGIVFITLVLNTIITFYNKPIYFFLDNPKQHFAYEYHFTKELAQKLNNIKIDKIICTNEALQKKLLFYGIRKGGDYILTHKKPKNYSKELSFYLFGKKINSYYLKGKI